MSTPAYITLEDLQRPLSADEVEKLQGRGVSLAHIGMLTNEEVHG